MKNLEWVFKLTDQVSPAAKDIATNLNGVKKVLDTISSSTALPGLEKTAKALGGMARGFALLNDADKVVPQMQAIGNALPDLAIAADLTSKEIGALGKAFAQMSSGDKLVKVNQELPILARNLNSFRINTNAITGVSVLSKSMGALATATNRLNANKLQDFGIALGLATPYINNLRVNPGTAMGVHELGVGLGKFATATNKIGPNAATLSTTLTSLNAVNLSTITAELNVLHGQMVRMMDSLKQFKGYMLGLANALKKIENSNISNLKDININVRNAGGGGTDRTVGGAARRRQQRNGIFGPEMRFGNLLGFPAGALSSIGGALGNRAFSGLSLAGRFMSSSGPLIGALSALTAATISLKNTFLGIAQQERNIMKMGTLFGKERAMPAMAFAIDFAAQTPFELEGVISAISKLRGSAQLTEQQITPILQSMADLGAATGMTSEKMAGGMEQLVQMIGLGTAHLEELNIIAENGIPIFQAIAQETGMSMKEIREATSKNKLDAITVSNALITFSRKNYFGAAAEGAKTLSGMMDQLSSRATYFNLLMAMGPLQGGPDVLKNFKKVLANLLDLTDPKKEPGATIFKNIQNIVQTIDQVLFGGLAKLTDPKLATDAIVKFLEDLNGQLRELKPLLRDAKEIFTILLQILAKLQPLVKLITDAVYALYDAYISLDDKTRDMVNSMVAFGIAGWLVWGVVGRIVAAFGFLRTAWIAVAAFFKGIPMIAKAAMTFLRGVPGMIAAFGASVLRVIRLFTIGFLFNPLTFWVTMGILAFSMLLPAIVKHWDTIMAWLGDAWDTIKSWASGFVDWWNGLFAGSGEQIGKSIANGMTKGIASATPQIEPIVNGQIQSMKDAWAISSPSKVSMEMGQNVGLGFIKGFDKTYPFNGNLVPAFSAPVPTMNTNTAFAPNGYFGTAPVLPQSNANPVGSMPPVSVNINVTSNGDAKMVAEEVRKVAVSAVLEALETAAGEAGIWQ